MGREHSVTGETEKAIPVRDPRSGTIQFWITPPDANEVRAACDRLRAAQPAWAAMPVEARAGAMRKWAEEIQRLREVVIAADSADTGDGQISRIAPDMVAGFIHASTAAAPHQIAAMMRQGDSPTVPGVRYETVLKPYPLVGVISPWNAPTMLSMLRAIPALMAGCAVMVKPSEVTPRFVGAIRQTLENVPELQAVFGFLLGDGATGAALVETVDFVSFTGSVPNGRRVAEACARRLIPFESELGGKDPLIVLEGANLDDAAAAALRGAVTSTGQVCFSIERIYVARTIHDDFVAKLADKAARAKLNAEDPLKGPLSPFISARQAEIVDAHLDDAVAKGARIVTGGRSEEIGGGLYMRATVLTGVTHDMAIMREETFGPVMPVMAFDGEDEAVRLANDTAFGLSAAVIGADEAAALRVARRIDAGNVSVQDAFLTFAAGPAEADSFGVSGLGGKRSGVQRYIRRQALLVNSGKPACLLERGLDGGAQ